MKRVAIVISILFFSLALVGISVAVAQSSDAGTAASVPTAGTVSQETRSSITGGSCSFGDWQSVDPVNTGRSRTGLAYLVANGKFYMAGGEATGGNRAIPIEEYDPVGNTWTDKANLLTGVSNTGAAAVGSYVYVPGGYNGTAGITDMQRFDPVANLVITVAAMPGVNYAHAVTVLDDKIYVLGGSSTGAAGTTNFIYDVTGNSWSTGAGLPTAVQYPAAASDGTYVYVLGGNTTNIATVQRYDPVGNTWDTIASMNTGRGGPGAFFDGTNLWAIGGGWTTYLPSTEYWDGVAWQAGPDMTVGVRTVGAAFGDGMALKAAGWNGAYEDDAEILIIECGPEANPDVYTTTEDITLDVPAPGVLGNDLPDPGSLTAVLDTAPTNGELALNADGSFTYTPTQDFNGMDSFTYYATDGITNSNSANVDIWVTAVNDAPVANDDNYAAAEDIPLVISAPGVLDNDSDVEVDPLTAVLNSNASNGSVVLNADGSFTYTPDLDYCGTDSFTYYANDGSDDSNIATATIEVECDTTDDAYIIYLPVVINN